MSVTNSSNLKPVENLSRALGLKEAVALNMIDMVGIGPFIVIPLVIGTMGGPQSILAWVVGAVLAFIDAAVWAELGAAMPHAGGSYVFLREIYGANRWGRLVSFLFIWQTMFQAPLVMASGAIGFSQYFTYLVPLSPLAQKAVSGGVVIILIVLLYRHIASVGKISLFLWIGVIGTVLWLIVGGAMNFRSELAFTYPDHAWDLSFAFFAALGHATINTIYTYLGYYNVCHLGAEIREPERNIPRSMFLSIVGIAILYLLMQLSVLGVIPWEEAQHSSFIVSTFVERTFGPGFAMIATAMILWIAFSSLFSLTLGYSRIPYAAALDGMFFRVFSKVHPTKNFPHISLLALGAFGFVFSLLFRLSDVITAILAMRILVQFVGQAAGIFYLHRRWPEERFPFRMWLYPLPPLAAILLWLALFASTGWMYALAGIGVMVVGTVVYLIRAKARSEFPFQSNSEEDSLTNRLE